MERLISLRNADAVSRRRRAQTAQPRADFKETKYMHNPPGIMPNYGKKKTTLGVPKTSMSRVLLYDNITQQQMLDMKLAHIKIEKQRTERLMNLHKKSFSLQMAKRHRQFTPSVPINNTDSEFHLPSANRNVSVHSRMTGRQSVMTLEDVNLPKINNSSRHSKEIILQLKTKSGKKRLYHSYDDSGIFVDVVPLHSFYPSIKDDPRFQYLEETLIAPEQDVECDGFAILSPSYPKKFPKFPTFLMEDKVE